MHVPVPRARQASGRSNLWCAPGGRPRSRPRRSGCAARANVGSPEGDRAAMLASRSGTRRSRRGCEPLGVDDARSGARCRRRPCRVVTSTHATGRRPLADGPAVAGAAAVVDVDHREATAGPEQDAEAEIGRWPRSDAGAEHESAAGDASMRSSCRGWRRRVQAPAAAPGGASGRVERERRPRPRGHRGSVAIGRSPQVGADRAGSATNGVSSVEPSAAETRAPERSRRRRGRRRRPSGSGSTQIAGARRRSALAEARAVAGGWSAAFDATVRRPTSSTEAQSGSPSEPRAAGAQERRRRAAVDLGSRCDHRVDGGASGRRPATGRRPSAARRSRRRSGVSVGSRRARGRRR